MPVSVQQTIFHHVGNGLTITFPFGCQILQPSDLQVYLNDELTTSGFGVSGIGVPAGGAVTFDIPPADLAQVRIERVIPLERITDYQQNGDYLSKVVNPDFDRIWMALQQHQTMFGRGLSMPTSDPAGPPALLPSIANRANNLLGFDADGKPVAIAPAAQSATALQSILAATTGPGLLGWIRSAAGAVATTLAKWLSWQEPSVLEFMTEAQITDVHSANPVLDHTAAFTAFIAHLALSGKSGRVPAAGYNLSNTIDVLAGVSVKISPKARIKFTSVASPIFRIRKGVTFLGSGARLNISNPLWNGIAVLLDGADKFKEDDPTEVTGFAITGADIEKGTGLEMRAIGAQHYISFVKLRGFSFTNLRFGLIVVCGSDGLEADPATWHWINSNIFENFTFFYTKFGMSVVGTPLTPAEVAANAFLNFHFQPGEGLPVYFSGACKNLFTGYIWDWNATTHGNAVQFDNGAVWNEFHSNIGVDAITGASGNKCFDLTGGETGQKIFTGPFNLHGPTYIGRSGTNGQYAVTMYPDTANNGVFWWKNTTGNFVFGSGVNAYAGTDIYAIDGSGRMTIGGTANSSLSRLRVIGEASKGAMAVRMGSDGFAGVLFENSAGTAAGVITVNTSATTYGTSSDYRLKKQIAPLTDSGGFIDALKPRTWRWKIDDTEGVGFIAHELQAVSPSSVSGAKDQEDEEENPVYQSVEYGSSEVIANMVAEMQDLRLRVAALEGI